MVDPVELSVFLAATLVIMITPGPDMLYVLARTFGQGRRAGLLSVAGIAGGILVHTRFSCCASSARRIFSTSRGARGATCRAPSRRRATSRRPATGGS